MENQAFTGIGHAKNIELCCWRSSGTRLDLYHYQAVDVCCNRPDPVGVYDKFAPEYASQGYSDEGVDQT